MTEFATVFCLAKEGAVTSQAKTRRRWLFAQTRVCNRLLWKPQERLLEVLFRARDDETWNHPGRQEEFWQAVFAGVLKVSEIRPGGTEWLVSGLHMAIVASEQGSHYPGYVEIVFEIDTRNMKNVPLVADPYHPRLLFVFRDGEQWQTA